MPGSAAAIARLLLLPLTFPLLAAACSSPAPGTPDASMVDQGTPPADADDDALTPTADAGPDAANDGPAADASACTLAANTTPTDTVSSQGCHELTRDASACQADRQAAGLSGYWLKFSCRVTLSMTGSGASPQVQAVSDGQPDY